MFRLTKLSLACMAMLLVPSTYGADRAYVSACWQKTYEGSRESRARKAALRACHRAGLYECQVVDTFCYDSRHCFATVASCVEYEGRGSKPYRALRDALRQCQDHHDHCRVDARETRYSELEEYEDDY